MRGGEIVGADVAAAGAGAAFGSQAPGTTLCRSPINGMQPPALPAAAAGAPPLALLTETFRLSLLTLMFTGTDTFTTGFDVAELDDCEDELEDDVDELEALFWLMFVEF